MRRSRLWGNARASDPGSEALARIGLGCPSTTVILLPVPSATLARRRPWLRWSALVAGTVAVAATIAGVSVLGGTTLPPGQEQQPAREDADLLAFREVRQNVTVRAMPALVQPGVRPAPASSAALAFEATVQPAPRGRRVELQRRTPKGWVRVDRDAVTTGSRVVLAAPATASPSSYRVVAAAYRGLRTATSAPVSTRGLPEPTWTDDFTGTSLGTDWSHRLQGYAPTSLRACSRADESTVAVADGTLRLSVVADPARTDSTCTVKGRPYAWRLNAHVGTQGKRTFRYGYAAARVRFQPRQGQHGAFWLQPDAPTAPEGPPAATGAEIDVIEWFGEAASGRELASFVYHYPTDGTDGITPVKTGGWIEDAARFGQGWATSYHVFSVEWTPREYVFRIDGQESFRTRKGVSGQKQYLILSLLSSDYELRALGGETKLPQTMSVDWVRYWETPGR